jgi:putative Ca2+/H+ antiporter (TMEM165/GDT1 family)
MKFLIFILITLIFDFSYCAEIFKNETNFDLSKFKEKLEINVSFSSSFIQSFILIFISEIADKTFIIILLFSAKRKSVYTFFAALISILFANYLSIFIGLSIDLLLYKNVIDWLAFFLLIIYGISTLSDAFEMSEKKVEDRYLNLIEIEYKQKKKTIKEKQFSRKSVIKLDAIKDQESNIEKFNELKEPMMGKENLNMTIEQHTITTVDDDEETNLMFYWLLFSSIFTAECGDKSQTSTIIISAVFNIYGVIFGTTLALIICVYLNFYYGHSMANYMTEKHVNLICGICFLLCGSEILLIKLNLIKF